MASRTTVAEIRQHKRNKRLAMLEVEAKQLIGSYPGSSLWPQPPGKPISLLTM